MCQLMKATVLLLLLLHCSNGITVGPIYYVVSLVLTATFEFSLLSTVQSTETSILMLVSTEDVNSIPITSMMTSTSMVTPSTTFPVPPSLMESTEIIIFPTDIVTGSVLFTTDGGTVNTSSVPITTTLSSVMTIPVISTSDVIPSTLLFTSTEGDSIPTSGLTSALITTFESVSSVVTDQASVTPVMLTTSFTTSILGTSSLTESTLIVLTTTDLSNVVSPTASLAITTPVVTTTLASFTIIVTTSLEVTSTQFSTMMSQTTTSSLQSPINTASVTLMSSPSDVTMTTLPVVTITVTPSPTPTVAPPNLAIVVMRYGIVSSTVKRDTNNYTDIEFQIANATGISAERINIVSVRQESNETILINATIVELTSNEFITLNTTINNGMVSITFEGRAYASLSIEIQPQPGCNEHNGRNYDCIASSINCPSDMMCQAISNSTSSFCVPCQCNLLPGDGTCMNGCIGNVCVPLPSTTVITVPLPSTTVTVPLPSTTVIVTAPPPSDDDNDDDEGLSDRAIAGIVVGTTVPLVLICILGAILLHRRRSSGHFTPKQLSMKKVGSKKSSSYQSVRTPTQQPEWGSTIYRNANEMFTLSQQLAEEKDTDEDIQEYTMFTDL